MGDAPDELLGVPSMRARGGVGREDHFRPRRTHRQRADLEVARQVALHDRHALFREAGRADVARLVLEIVLDHQADLRTDESAGLYRGVDIRLSGVGEVLDLPASCTRGGANLRTVGVHHRAQPEGRGLVAHDSELRFGDRWPGTDSLALRRKDLDQVRALLLTPPDHRPE